MRTTQPPQPALTPAQTAVLAGLTVHDAALIAAAMDAELGDSTRVQRPAFTDRVLPFDLSAACVLARYRLPEHAPLNYARIAAIAQSAATMGAAARPGSDGPKR